MFNSGDLIKYNGKIARYRTGRPFTVVEKYPYRDDVYSCIRSGMTYTRQFKEEDIELLETIPKFSLGDAVEITHNGVYRQYNVVGVIMASNQAGSIVRFADEYQHNSLYMPNSKVRKIK